MYEKDHSFYVSFYAIQNFNIYIFNYLIILGNVEIQMLNDSLCKIETLYQTPRYLPQLIQYKIICIESTNNIGATETSEKKKQ